jgi:hypothetical protein
LSVTQDPGIHLLAARAHGRTVAVDGATEEVSMSAVKGRSMFMDAVQRGLSARRERR